MKKKDLQYYCFDPSTGGYTKVVARKRRLFLRATGLIIVIVVSAACITWGYTSYFELPREIALKHKVKELEEHYEHQYKTLNAAVSSLDDVVKAIEKRDDHLYRSILGAEPIDISVREGGVGGSERYEDLKDSKINYTSLLISTHAKIDKLKRKLYVEAISQDELFSLADEKRRQYAAVPAIQPLSNKELSALASGFGMRMHPVYKVMKMHTGIDFSSPLGSPVYATADGQVVEIDTAARGYGKIIILDHGYGYQTRYAHVQEFKAKVGDHIKRGELIALSGNTGVSTAPHLHYEVIHNGIQINPINYFFNDLSPLEYEKIVKLASIENQSLGN